MQFDSAHHPARSHTEDQADDLVPKSGSPMEGLSKETGAKPCDHPRPHVDLANVPVFPKAGRPNRKTPGVVQRLAAGHGGTPARGLAQAGVSGASRRLPHFDRIQQAFGRFDISRVEAHAGDRAAGVANAVMGAEAFTVGNHVAFRQSQPSLHTTAHEAAHVIQQRQGVSLQNGVGREGDRYERQADHVADAVARGDSAEPVLNQFVGRASPSNIEAAPAIQCLRWNGSKVDISKLSPEEVRYYLGLLGSSARPSALGEEHGDEAALRHRLSQLVAPRTTTSVANQPDIVIPTGGAPADGQLGLPINGGVIPGPELLRLVHRVVQQFINAIKHKFGTLQSGQSGFQILGGPDWLRSAGMMAGPFSKAKIEQSAPRTMLNSQISVSHSQTGLRLESRDKTERLFFADDSDPSYARLLALRQHIQMTDQEIALALMHKLRTGAHYNHMNPATVQFLDGLNALLLGLEGSRANATFATGPMTLELMAAGQMTFTEAFGQNQFGGQFPLAALQTGGGNFSSRRAMIEGTRFVGQFPHGRRTNFTNAEIEAEMQQQPVRNQIPIKEIMVIINYLVGNYGGVLATLDEGQARALITQVLHELLDRYFGVDLERFRRGNAATTTTTAQQPNLPAQVQPNLPAQVQPNSSASALAAPPPSSAQTHLPSTSQIVSNPQSHVQPMQTDVAGEDPREEIREEIHTRFDSFFRSIGHGWSGNIPRSIEEATGHEEFNDAVEKEIDRQLRRHNANGRSPEDIGADAYESLLFRFGWTSE